MVVVTVLIGLFVLAVDLILSYGGVMLWHEQQKLVSAVMFLSVFAMTISYVDTVIRVWFA